jgi:hypothetical protein
MNFLELAGEMKEIKFSYEAMRKTEALLNHPATKFHEILQDLDSETLIKVLALATSSRADDIICALDEEKICLMDILNAVMSAFVRYIQGESKARQITENLSVQNQSK